MSGVSSHFADRLLAAVEAKRNPSVVGLDSDFNRLPAGLRERYRQRYSEPFQAASECLLEFNRQILAAVADVVPAVKIQIAFYEQLGVLGMEVFQETVALAREAGLIVIGDAKRNDIGNTSQAYSRAFLGRIELFGEALPIFDVDALTVNAWFGSDGVAPLLADVERYGKGIFILVKTSNASSGELQDLDCGGKPVYERMAELTDTWGRALTGRRGYSAVGAVVGATYPREAERLRAWMPNAILLVPGYGAQGGTADDVMPCFNREGTGALVNSSRDILFAWQKADLPEAEFAAAARAAAVRMREALRESMTRAGIYPW